MENKINRFGIILITLFISFILINIIISRESSVQAEDSLNQYNNYYIDYSSPYDEILNQENKEELQSNKANYNYEIKYIPDIDNSFKTYMSYKAISNKSSNQWKLQQLAYTDDKGFRKIDNYYLVAVGTYYSEKVGTKLRITLEDNKVIDAIVGDIKKDIHTDSNNQYVLKNGNMIEFIVDIDKLEKLSKKMGDVSYSGMKGKIIKIEELIECY